MTGMIFQQDWSMKKKSVELSDVRVVGLTPQQPASQKFQKQTISLKMEAASSLDAVNMAAKSMQSDAPACNVCGHITIRSGTCYKCLNCGNSMGCS